MCTNANPCLHHFADVVIVPQPSSHASPGGCGGAENSSQVKMSFTKNCCLVCNSLSMSGPRATFHQLKLNVGNMFSSGFGPFANCQQGNSLSGQQASWAQCLGGNVTGPKKGQDPRPPDTKSGREGNKGKASASLFATVSGGKRWNLFHSRETLDRSSAEKKNLSLPTCTSPGLNVHGLGMVSLVADVAWRMPPSRVSRWLHFGALGSELE